MKIRASIGTAAALGIESLKTAAEPTTGYLMQYYSGHCSSNCAFCPQAAESSGKTDHLSRILWPDYPLSKITQKLIVNPGPIKRICIQTINFPNWKNNLVSILASLKEKGNRLPISVCCVPAKKEFFQQLKKKGTTRIGIALDCATPDLFNDIKGKNRGINVSWDQMLSTLKDAIAVFGSSFTTTHLIIGLGETEEEALRFIQKFLNHNITIGLFAFTPIKGTALAEKKQPPLKTYRRIQLAKYLLETKNISLSDLSFNDQGQLIHFGLPLEELRSIIQMGKPFLTSGCPHCNRPFYNESPNKELYNFPRNLTSIELQGILDSFKNQI
ncbi:radical SAM protein [Candidatus Heimdallarchaeota archaeon]|nr:MAG: radical SAM protein [Candidatus Heimdallarchaeota archaeon]